MTASSSISLANFKAFGQEPQGFQDVRSVNVVIGRNNSGKSALLDAVRFLADGEFTPDPLASRSGTSPSLVIRSVLEEEDVLRAFSRNLSGGAHIRGNHFEYGKAWIGQTLTWELRPGGKRALIAADPSVPDGLGSFFTKIVAGVEQPLSGMRYRGVSSERDVRPESDDFLIGVHENGEGVTTTIRHFLTKVALDRDLVDIQLLGALNQVFHPEARFDEIEAQQHDDGTWELFLLERSKGLVPLSQSGSGIKTVVQVLSNLVLVPSIDGADLAEYIFVFEELENNLHPALQRRLFSFLRDQAVESEFRLFLSTHSNVVIDLFSSDKEAQIVHVTHDGDEATVSRVVSYVHRRGILDDLGIRASDLLQSNGIVWVEGPTDRLYFNRWLELETDGALREGFHYQCVLYGGRLLAHLTAMDLDAESGDLFSMLTVNRNVLFLGDSDKVDGTKRLNKTKSRVRKEVEAAGGIAWFTKGREIENYMHADAVSSVLGVEAQQVEQYERFEEYLLDYAPDEANRYQRRKIQFAERILPALLREHLDVLDLKVRVAIAVKEIRRWNGIGAG